eukprot:11997155-Prorocentrum_lima.AAC.1
MFLNTCVGLWQSNAVDCVPQYVGQTLVAQCSWACCGARGSNPCGARQTSVFSNTTLSQAMQPT